MFVGELKVRATLASKTTSLYLFLLRVVPLRSMQNLLNTISLSIKLSAKHAIFLSVLLSVAAVAVVGVAVVIAVAVAVVLSLVSAFKCQLKT